VRGPRFLREDDATVAAVQKGISLPALQRLMGHDRLTTTEIYLNLSPEEVLREFREKRKELIRWFWRSAFSGYFGGWNTGMMARDQKAVDGFAAREAATLFCPPVSFGDEIWLQRPFRTN
jgi:hypothetical protein